MTEKGKWIKKKNKRKMKNWKRKKDRKSIKTYILKRWFDEISISKIKKKDRKSIKTDTYKKENLIKYPFLNWKKERKTENQ